jgi:hypothetical protein
MSWSRQRITIFAGVIFTAHVVAIFALHSRDPIRVEIKNLSQRSLRSAETSEAPPPGVDGLNDPLVFAGAHEHGFSASAWLMRPRPDYTISNSVPPPRFLSFTRPALTLAQPNTVIELESTLPLLKLAVSSPPPESVLKIEGELQGRGLLRAPEIPIQFATEVLSNTVVEVAVRADGFPFSARIISGSGSRLVDLNALTIANTTRFTPLPPAHADRGALQWGALEFQWFTAEPGTNTSPRAAISAAK